MRETKGTTDTTAVWGLFCLVEISFGALPAGFRQRQTTVAWTPAHLEIPESSSSALKASVYSASTASVLAQMFVKKQCTLPPISTEILPRPKNKYRRVCGNTGSTPSCTVLFLKPPNFAHALEVALSLHLFQMTREGCESLIVIQRVDQTPDPKTSAKPKKRRMLPPNVGSFISRSNMHSVCTSLRDCLAVDSAR